MLAVEGYPSRLSHLASTVFNAGTTDWASGLDGDATVQRVTANVLTRLSARGG